MLRQIQLEQKIQMTKDYGILLIWVEKCKWRVEMCVKEVSLKSFNQRQLTANLTYYLQKPYNFQT